MKCKCGNETFVPVVTILSESRDAKISGNIKTPWTIEIVGMKCVGCGVIIRQGSLTSVKKVYP